MRGTESSEVFIVWEIFTHVGIPVSIVRHVSTVLCRSEMDFFYERLDARKVDCLRMTHALWRGSEVQAVEEDTIECTRVRELSASQAEYSKRSFVNPTLPRQLDDTFWSLHRARGNRYDSTYCL